MEPPLVLVPENTKNRKSDLIGIFHVGDLVFGAGIKVQKCGLIIKAGIGPLWDETLQENFFQISKKDQ
jgi:repressor of nif and glnA expression